jgi:acetate kinase
MKILVVNSGSSSIKCTIFDGVTPLSDAHISWRGQFEAPKISINGRPWKRVRAKSAIDAFEELVETMKTPNAIGHRIVHGGRIFNEPCLITKSVKEKIKKLGELAPLHNAAELKCIELLEKRFKGVPQIAVFDTAFHHTISEEAAIYPGPYRWVKEGIMRYGFHGISFQYCAKRAESIVPRCQKMVICHLGAGASLCAVREGKSVDTTMGFTPLDGLMMDTRSGSVDPGILLHLLKKGESLKGLSKELYEESGLLGISGFSSDMKEILENLSKPRAALALDIYIHRLNSCLGSMIASLQGIDTLVFTGGIGENAAIIRKRVCENFAFLGVKLKRESNSSEDEVVSSLNSKVRVLVIHTQEALEIAKETLSCLL